MNESGWIFSTNIGFALGAEPPFHPDGFDARDPTDVDVGISAYRWRVGDCGLTWRAGFFDGLDGAIPRVELHIEEMQLRTTHTSKLRSTPALLTPPHHNSASLHPPSYYSPHYPQASLSHPPSASASTPSTGALVVSWPICVGCSLFESSGKESL